MGIAISLTVFAIGAIFGFAVRAQPSGLDLGTVGAVLMLVGVVGFATSIYREHWRRRIVEESIESGTAPPVVLDDDFVVEEERESRQPAQVILHEHLVPASGHDPAGGWVGTGGDASAAPGGDVTPPDAATPRRPPDPPAPARGRGGRWERDGRRRP